MDKPTLYDMAITDITNRIHECSQVTESIENKTAFIRTFPNDSTPEDPEAADSDCRKKEAYPTELADRLGELKKNIDKLHQRLCDLDDSVYTITHLKPDC